MSGKKRKRYCASCDRLRRGSSRRAWVMTAHGELRSGIVCARCAFFLHCLHGSGTVVAVALAQFEAEARKTANRDEENDGS